MSRRAMKFLIVSGILAFGLLAGLIAEQSPAEESGLDNVNTSFALAPPAFAQGVPGDQFPASEAGVSAYIRVGESVDIKKARALFRGIQASGIDYLVGIVEIKGLPEELWPHLYVNADGWFLAYYSKFDPASKLMPWNGYQGGPITTTTLREALVQFTTQYFASTQVAFSFSAVEEDLHYYDFRYPEATAFVLAADQVGPDEEEDSLRYAIPTGVLVYEGSWAHYASDVHTWSTSQVDKVELYRGKKGTYFTCGLLEDQYLRKEAPHTATILKDGWGGDRSAGIAVAFIYH